MPKKEVITLAAQIVLTMTVSEAVASQSAIAEADIIMALKSRSGIH